MPKLNDAWHEKHPMLRKPTLEQRVKWHVGHAKACGCREIPQTILIELRARGIKSGSNLWLPASSSTIR